MQTTIPLPETPRITAAETNRATIEIDGCWPGYGMTIGNALRRVILSSLPGAAVTAVKIKGVMHEFSTVPGVLEDVVTIMLNLKQIRLKLHGPGPVRATLETTGKKTVTAGDIKSGSEVEIVNPTQHIATLTAPDSALEMELEIEEGMGYVPVEERRKEKLEVGLIALDAIFSPIRRVNYEVENMRVGDRTDYNRIRFDIETDGTLTPEEAFARSVDILIRHFERLRETRPAAAGEYAEIKEAAAVDSGKPSREDGAASQTTPKLVEELNLSTRIGNILGETGLEKISSVTARTEQELLQIPGLGEKALKDIKKALGKLGFTLRESSGS